MQGRGRRKFTSASGVADLFITGRTPHLRIFTVRVLMGPRI